MRLIKTNIMQQTFSTNIELNYPFNQIIFINYDIVKPVRISSDIILQPAIVSGGIAYPTTYTIALNVGEVANDRVIITLDFDKSTTAKLVVQWTEYSENQ